MERLTYSRLSTMRRCPRQHWYKYELRLGRERTGDALRIGTIYHKALELWATTGDEEKVYAAIDENYAITPHWIDDYRWSIEHVVVSCLVSGYIWLYKDEPLEYIAVEEEFSVPLVNPDTGAPSRTFELAGKYDAIVRLMDRREAVKENKTTSEDLSPDSDYWLRLRGDQQVSQYFVGARANKHPVDTVLYDATRKPTIKPRQVPVLDEEGRKIVVDEQGARVFLLKKGEPTDKPRQSASSKDGFTLRTRKETPEEYSERLLADIGARPSFYYARREVPRLEDDLAEFQLELWQQAKQLRESQRAGRWFRNISRQTCEWCDYSDLCLNSVKINLDEPPAGFVVRDTAHPELSKGDTE